MQRLLPFLVLADIALIVVAMFDCVTADSDVGRALPRSVWLVLILLLSPIGPIAWFVNRSAEERAESAGPAETDVVSARRLPPDDDPEFLQELARRAKEAGEIHRAAAERRAEAGQRAEVEQGAEAEQRAKAEQEAEAEQGADERRRRDRSASDDRLPESRPPAASDD